MHEPVLVNEVVDLLGVRAGGVYVDGTVGSGGHAAAILEKAGATGFLLGMDRDGEALARARSRLTGHEGSYALVQGDYADMAGAAAQRGLGEVNGIVLDLGVSAEQLESAERGFSFVREGPLDMRMDASRGESAADLLQRVTETDLAALIRRYGEEPNARRIARRIVREREKDPIRTTGRLARVVERALGGRRGKRHPATRTFQALRIAVNGELASLEKGLPAALGLLQAGGRMAVISFHSLEDRMVKRFFVRHEGRWESLQEGGRAWRGEEPAVARVTRRAVRPSAVQTETNPRARSARLRVAERLTAGAHPSA